MAGFAHKVGIVSNIIRLIISMASQNDADGVSGKIVQRAPCPRLGQITPVGARQMYCALLNPIVKMEVKTAGYGNENLREFAVRMPRTLGKLGNVVQIVNTFDVEGDMPFPLYKAERAPHVMNGREINPVTLGEGALSDFYGWSKMECTIGKLHGISS